MNLGNYIVPEETQNGICFDIGSNFGDFTNRYANYFSKIYFFEPQLELFNNIVERFKEHEHIKGFNKAVWHTSNVELEMVAHTNTDLGSVGVSSDLLNSDWTDNTINSVQSISIEDIYEMADNQMIDYLKIDCETSEYPFLLNKDLTKIKFIGIELHHHIGVEKYNELLNWIKKTHDLIYGDDSYMFGSNKEVLYKLKA